MTFLVISLSVLPFVNKKLNASIAFPVGILVILILVVLALLWDGEKRLDHQKV